MEVRDLMVGNYIKWKDNGSVFEITIDLFCDKHFHIHFEKGYFEPISLTEEILLKCSLDKWIINNRFECRHNYNNSVSIYAWRNGKSIFIVDLLFLHELQNWYYLHAKKELEISLK